MMSRNYVASPKTKQNFINYIRFADYGMWIAE
jgi:hypothetical protein